MNQLEIPRARIKIPTEKHDEKSAAGWKKEKKIESFITLSLLNQNEYDWNNSRKSLRMEYAERQKRRINIHTKLKMILKKSLKENVFSFEINGFNKRDPLN